MVYKIHLLLIKNNCCFTCAFLQMKNGIANDHKQSATAKLVTIATSGEAAKIAVPNPGNKALERSSKYFYI